MGAADFLFTPAVQRVLGLTFAHPERAYTLKELLNSADGGRGNSQRQIDRLIAVGVLVEEPRRGRQRSIRANVDFFLYPELRSIALKTFGLVEPLREALEPFSHAINEAFVFGSVAKGTDTQRSDIDLIVIGAVSLLALTSAMFELERKLGRSIHLNLYAADEWEGLRLTDTVMAQISESTKTRILPHDSTD